MKVKDSFKLKGKIGIVARDAKTGEIVWEETKDNLVVTVGKELSLDRLFGINGPPEKIKSIGVGSSNEAAAVGNTKLIGASTAFLDTETPTRAGTAVTAKIEFKTTEANFEWKELGLFTKKENPPTGESKMLNRVVIGPFNKTEAVSITVTVEIKQT